RMAASEEPLTIAPPPALAISGTAYFIIRNWPRTLTLHIVSNCSIVVSSRRPPIAIPTLLTNRLSWPKMRTVASQARRQSSSRVTSAATESARPPSARIAAAVSPPSASERSATITAAPSRAHRIAVARPLPIESVSPLLGGPSAPPPTISATFPSRRLIAKTSVAPGAIARARRLLRAELALDRGVAVEHGQHLVALRRRQGENKFLKP